jgi:hypothetical protein
MSFDPWGPIDWLVTVGGAAVTENVLCLGSLSFEERSVAVPIFLSQRGAAQIHLLKINDPSSRHTTKIEQEIVARRATLLASGVRFAETTCDLLATDEEIAQVFRTAVATARRQPTCLWLDISSMPKRYFFLMVKLALLDARVETLITTYTQPTPAGYVDAHLAEDPDDLRPLPGYASIVDPTTLVIAVGFESLGLPQFLSEYRDKSRRIIVFIPFPPGQPYAQRIWQAVQRLGLKTVGPDARRVAALDAFETARQLEAVLAAEQARAGAATAVSLALAPYGPKPMSLGMCLFAINRDAPVFYTQPKSYHPHYTSGIGQSWGYLLKLRGVGRAIG